MIPQLINKIIPSFIYFLDHSTLQNGRAYKNIISGSLAAANDPSLPDKAIYGSPYRQFVSDYSVIGANIPSGVVVNSMFVEKGVSGLKMDYEMGRAIFDSPLSSNTNVTCSYAFKDYNIYYNENQDEQIIFDAKYDVRPSYVGGNNPILKYNQIVYPAIFIKTQYSEHVPFAFGGARELQADIRAIYLSDSQYLLDAGVSIASELTHKYFPILHPSDMPFNLYGDYKRENFNYLNLCSVYSQTGSLMAIVDSVKISKFSPQVNRLVGDGCYGGFADFTIKYIV